MKPRKLVQVDKYGDVIREWSSAKEVSQVLNVDVSCVYCVLSGRNYTCKGYRFRYK